MRLDLGDDDYALIRHKHKIPRGLADNVRVEIEALAASASTDVNIDPSDPDAAAEAGRAVLASGNGFMGPYGRLQDALTLAVVIEWSFGDVTLENLKANVPDSVVQRIYRHCDEQGYSEALVPDFSVSPDEESPTTPS